MPYGLHALRGILPARSGNRGNVGGDLGLNGRREGVECDHGVGFDDARYALDLLGDIETRIDIAFQIDDRDQIIGA